MDATMESDNYTITNCLFTKKGHIDNIYQDIDGYEATFYDGKTDATIVKSREVLCYVEFS